MCVCRFRGKGTIQVEGKKVIQIRKNVEIYMLNAAYFIYAFLAVFYIQNAVNLYPL